jgi:hypothetical protein
MAHRALILALAALLGACLDPVARARDDLSASPRPLPAPAPDALLLAPAAQACLRPEDCALTWGHPDQPPQPRCCAHCDAAPLALHRDHRDRLDAWKQASGCAHVACDPLGDCADAPRPWGATCRDGLCALLQ